MTRPALSATRALEFLDLMAASPKQSFTLSELARMTGIAVASCHGILNALVKHGHLSRHPEHKTYHLAPALFAIGQTVREHDPLLAGACVAAEMLANETGLEVLLTARAGAEIIALKRVARGPLPRISMRVGERAPLHPPVGVMFMAWAPQGDVEDWLGRVGDAERHAEADSHNLALLRKRGFLVVLRSQPQERMQSELAAAGRPSAIGRPQFEALMEALYGGTYQPPEIEPDALYPVSVISAPLFDAFGQVVYSLTLGGFDEAVTGERIRDLAWRLVAVCSDVMRESGIRR
jgi:DNA-binding IclR family transcriptional regulator